MIVMLFVNIFFGMLRSSLKKNSDVEMPVMNFAILKNE